MAGSADLIIFFDHFFASILTPLWSFWTAGSILTVSLLIWLLREIAKTVRKLY